MLSSSYSALLEKKFAHKPFLRRCRRVPPTQKSSSSWLSAWSVSWQYATRLLYLRYPGLKSNALLVLLPPENQTGRQCCRIYNYCSRKIHRIFLPQLQGGWYTASSHGWLLTVANQAIHLLNPITSATVKLPPEKRFRRPKICRMSSKKPEITRVITSTILRDPLCKALAIHPGKYGHRFSFCRTGDHAWIRINNFVGWCSDAIFYKGDFYAIDFYGYIWAIQPTVNNFQKAVKLSVEPVKEGCHCYYLVEVKGDLLMGVKKQCLLSACYIYQMDWEKKSWVRMKANGRMVPMLIKGGDLPLQVS
ncbi:hypothetical protein SLEP1_g13911 [Rubroshorea leprosula]|uniref:KIB1-4 beta-propeller domain-containing protein n=1 Tax=Rubroshorea leprosula TaxID=152421 RepID=A0AAV5IS19_9ROSI|nr:hypothetical protein SLEP1_g13911 [Rubroshorea leprosula]